jgi:hypothetical protein
LRFGQGNDQADFAGNPEVPKNDQKYQKFLKRPGIFSERFFYKKCATCYLSN